MGNKGDKMTNDSGISAELLVEKLAILGDVTSKKMFGGYGIFLDGKMFGMIDPKGGAYLKADADLKADFASQGSQPHSKMPYSSIPETVFGDTEKLVDWAKKSTALLKK